MPSLLHCSSYASVRVADLEIDLGEAVVSRGGEQLRLTPTELRLLEAFVRSRGRLLRHDELLDTVWGGAPGSRSDRVRSAVLALRRKLHDDAAQPRLILNEPGLGYRWISDLEATELAANEPEPPSL